MNFPTYLLCHYLTSFGSWLSLIALVSQLSVDFTSGVPVACALLAKRLPTAISYPFGGLIASRFGHSQSIKTINLISGLLLILLAIHCWTSSLSMPLLVIIYAGLSILDGLSKPVSRAFLASFTSCPQTIGRFNTALNVISVLGMLSASISVAVLNGSFSAGTIIFANAVFCLIAWILLKTPASQKVSASVQPCRWIPQLTQMAIPYSIAINCIYGLLMLIISQYPARVFHSSPSVSGILYTCAAVSALAGAIFYHQMQKEFRCAVLKKVLCGAAFAGMIIAFSGLSFSTELGKAVVLLSLCLIPFYYLKQHLESLVLLNCPVNDHGRTISYLYISDEIFIGIGIVCGTIMLDQFGELGMLVSGLSFGIIAGLLFLIQQRDVAIKMLLRFQKPLI